MTRKAPQARCRRRRPKKGKTRKASSAISANVARSVRVCWAPGLLEAPSKMLPLSVWRMVSEHQGRMGATFSVTRIWP